MIAIKIENCEFTFSTTLSLLPPSTHLKVPIDIKDCLLTSKDNSRMQNKAQQSGNQ